MKMTCCVVSFVLFTAFSVFAQIPSGSLIHLEGDAGIVDSVGKIKEWHDAANPLVKFFAPLPANQPSHSAALINGHKALTFDGVGNYLEGPSIFPVGKDYSVCIVTKITNTAPSSNLVSGTTHAIFLGGTIYPRFLHANFSSIATSTAPITPNASLIIARYNESNKFASFYVNGESGDSATVGPNTDTTVYIGAYQRANLLAGDIAEIIIYPRYISELDRQHLQDSLMRKYAIPGPQPPDLTFTFSPQQFQLYPRGSDDSAIVPIKGALIAKGFDSVYLQVLRNTASYKYTSIPLHYAPEGASFIFYPRIHAELSEYSFIVGVKSASKDSVLIHRDNIVCGDVIFVNGQSNSIAGGDTYSNEFCRTFGGNFSSSKHDTLWSLSSDLSNGGGSSVGCWPMRVQRNYVEKLGIPTALISGGVGGTAIESHLPTEGNPMNLQSIYGSMLYRATKSGLAKYAKAMFWYQGEANNAANYFDNFRQLYNAWHLDYPNIEKVYVMQIRPGCNSGTPGELRDLLRSLSDFYPDVVTHSTMALPGHDGCHFFLDGLIGYHVLGDQAFNLLMQDFYHSSDTIGIHSPDIQKAFYTDANHRTVALIFAPSGSGLVIPNDTIISTVHASIKDYFYVGNDTGNVTDLRVSGDTLFLDLTRPSGARSVTYLPDQVYNGTNVTYEGPWLTNKRGLGAFSFWKVPIQEYSNEVTRTSLIASKALLDIFPNPVSGSSDILFSLSERSSVKIEILNLLGESIRTICNDTKESGTYSTRFDTHFLPNGHYFIRSIVNGKFSVKAFEVLR